MITGTDFDAVHIRRHSNKTLKKIIEKAYDSHNSRLIKWKGNLRLLKQ